MKFLRLNLTIIFISLFVAISFSQTPTPPLVEDNNVVRISTSLIQVDATVLDKNGKIVKGLTADDFEIYENDKKQEITNFSFVELQIGKPTSVAPVVKTGRNSISIPPVPTDLRPEKVRRTLALVVDDVSLSMGSLDVTKSALKKFVDEKMQPEDLVAIIRTGGGGGFLQQFTSDKRILYKAIEKLRWSMAGGKVDALPNSDPSDTNGAIPGSIAGDLAIENNNKINNNREDAFVNGMLSSVNYVVNGMRELPGRKAVVVFSEGFALYDLDNGFKKPNPRLIRNFQKLTESANRASVVIYTMDTRGLIVTMPEAADNVLPTGGGKFSVSEGVSSQKITDMRKDALYETQQGLRALAELTGGFAVINNNSLDKGIERALNDQDGYYLLGYQPDEETFDSKTRRFNKLSVKLKRPELRFRYRSGFFGVKDEDIKEKTKTSRQQIFEALNSPFNAGEIDLSLTSLFANDTQTGDFMRSLLYVNGDALEFTDDADGWQKATFDVVAMVSGDDGNIIDEISRTQTIRAKADTLEEIREKGFVASVIVPVKKPGFYQMRVVIRDNATSRIGSASQLIEVPDLKKNRLTLSGILLQRIESDSGKASNEVKRKQFQSDEERDIAVRSFSPGTNVRFDYGIYNAKLDKTTKVPNLTMQFKIFKDGKETFVSREKSVKLTEKTDLQHLFAEGIFKLGKAIQPGDYVLQIIIKDLASSGKNQITAQSIDFEVTD